MQTFEILNSDGGVVNTILADESFVAAQYNENEYRVVVQVVTDEETEEAKIDLQKGWRDSELEATDHIPTITDHPQRAAYIAYRTALRDWPAKNDDDEYINDFPETRPTLPTE